MVKFVLSVRRIIIQLKFVSICLNKLKRNLNLWKESLNNFVSVYIIWKEIISIYIFQVYRDKRVYVVEIYVLVSKLEGIIIVKFLVDMEVFCSIII